MYNDGMEPKKNIVVLGAGFGGLRTAILLAKKVRRSGMSGSCRVFLVDKNSYHIYTPTLYEAATTSKEHANYLDIKSIVTFPVDGIVGKTGINFIQGEVKELDLQSGDIHLADARKLKFDYLVLALGSETNYFDIPGLKESSLALKTFLDAIRVRDKIIDLIQSGKEEIRVVIGGGGSTGVELAGELQNWLCELAEELPASPMTPSRGGPSGQRCRSRVTIVEAGPTLLPGFPSRIIEKVQRRLKGFGTEIFVNEAIDKVAPGKAALKSGRKLPFDLLIWTGGVKAASLMVAMPLKKEKRGRVEVAGEMECLPQSPDLKLYGKIYGLGDAVCFYDPVTGKPIPGVARAALSQAEVVAHNIWCDLTGQKKHEKYEPMEYPYIIPVGGKWAIAKVGPLIVWGFGGWVLKLLVEINYVISILPLWKAIRLWLKGLWIFIKNDRLG